jgi:hypothetical protein
MLCGSQDAHYVLLAGDKIYTLKGDKNIIQNFAGGNAPVNGRLTEDTLEVTAIGREVRDRQTKRQ